MLHENIIKNKNRSQKKIENRTEKKKFVCEKKNVVLFFIYKIHLSACLIIIIIFSIKKKTSSK